MHVFVPPYCGPQVMVSDPRRRQQLWCAADGLLVRQERRGEPNNDTAQAHPRRRGGTPQQGQGQGQAHGEQGSAAEPSGTSNEEFRTRREQARDLGIAKALYEVVSMPQLPPPQWHPGGDQGIVRAAVPRVRQPYQVDVRRVGCPP